MVRSQCKTLGEEPRQHTQSSSRAGRPNTAAFPRAQSSAVGACRLPAATRSTSARATGVAGAVRHYNESLRQTPRGTATAAQTGNGKAYNKVFWGRKW